MEQGLVELAGGRGSRVRYGTGELFFYEDLVSPDQRHSRDAQALTPLALIRLDRTGFLTLIHQHPTLLVDLIALQHRRLRQQRADARHVYGLVPSSRSRLRVTLAASTELTPLGSS